MEMALGHNQPYPLTRKLFKFTDLDYPLESINLNSIRTKLHLVFFLWFGDRRRKMHVAKMR